MKATPSEATNFFWHCLMAAKVMDELPKNTATKSHAVHAVRMATLCAAGRNGVQYASDAAIKLREAENKPWERCGLIKEHVVPVSLVRERVYDELKATRGQAAPNPFQPAGEDADALTSEVIALFQHHPRAWQVARIISEWTHLAWITKLENERFDDKARHGGISLRKRMPNGWTEEQGRLARYDACGIVLSRI